ncbi:MAG: hypothetical protein ACQERU_10890 [Bacteroidota bacterium]
MKKKNNEIIEKQGLELTEKKITRKEAIKKTGYMAASAATMMILLNKNANGQNGNGVPPTSPPYDAGKSNNSDDAVGTTIDRND